MCLNSLAEIFILDELDRHCLHHQSSLGSALQREPALRARGMTVVRVQLRGAATTCSRVDAVCLRSCVYMLFIYEGCPESNSAKNASIFILHGGILSGQPSYINL